MQFGSRFAVMGRSINFNDFTVNGVFSSGGTIPHDAKPFRPEL